MTGYITNTRRQNCRKPSSISPPSHHEGNICCPKKEVDMKITPAPNHGNEHSVSYLSSKINKQIFLVSVDSSDLTTCPSDLNGRFSRLQPENTARI